MRVMFHTLILQIISGIAGIWLATEFVTGVEFTGPVKTLIFAGAALGLINSFLKPILKIVALPLRLLTLGLFGIIINMGMVWLIDVYFQELIIPGLIPLFWTTLIIWGLSIVLFLFSKGSLKKA